MLKELVHDIGNSCSRKLIDDVLDLFLECLIICKRRSTINLVKTIVFLLRNLAFGIRLESHIILFNSMPCVIVILAKLLDSLRVSDLLIFLWENVVHTLTLKGVDVLTLEV